MVTHFCSPSGSEEGDHGEWQVDKRRKIVVGKYDQSIYIHM